MKTVDYKKHPPVINVTKATMDRLKKEECSGDLLALYIWYCYTTCWQDANPIWANVSYMAKLTKWSMPKVRRLRKQLLELNLIEDIQQRDENGSFTKKYVRVLYVTVVPLNRSTAKRTAKCLTTNREVLGTNNYRKARKRPCENGANTLLKSNNFTIRYGNKIQVKLKLHSKYTPVKAATWAKQINYLLHNMRIDKETFKEVMKWYFKEGLKLEYTPRIFKVKDLVDKWYSIEDAMKRSKEKKHKKESHAVYRMGGDGEMGYFEDEE